MSSIHKVLLFLMISFLCFIGCTKDIISPDTIPLFIPKEDNLLKNYVCIEQVRDFANKKWPQTKSNGEVDYTVMPYGKIDDTPLLYIVNYGNRQGWQILSSDARTPAVIAEGDNGYFSLEDGSPAVQVWLNCTATDILAVRKASDDELAFTPEEIEANKKVWNNDVIKGFGDDGDGGYWAVTIVDSEEIVEDLVEHMTPQWDQHPPYNAYCPIKTNNDTERADVGCVAVAASQVLYYLHNKWGIPENMYSYAYCQGVVHNYYRYFNGLNNTVWSQMDTTCHYYGAPADAESILMAYVGQEVEMVYGNSYSYTIPSKIRTHLFNQYNITASHGDYNASYVQANLENRLPVIVVASDQLIPLNGDIHTFVIDGFKKIHYRYTEYHYWVPMDPNQPKGPPAPQPYYTYSDSNSFISGIKINWGWRTQWAPDQPVNDGWFSLTAGWTVFDYNKGYYDYNYNIQMIYNLDYDE